MVSIDTLHFCSTVMLTLSSRIAAPTEKEIDKVNGKGKDAKHEQDDEKVLKANESLARALMHKVDMKKVEFSQQEFDALGVSGLTYDSYIQVCSCKRWWW
jgi:hypothetical protein